MHKNSQADNTVKHNPKFALVASCWAVGTALILVVIKTYAYYVSGSVAMLGTLIDSTVDAAFSIMLLFAVRLSLKPANKQHRHGHGKIEGIAALLQGTFMGGASIFLGLEAMNSFLNPSPVTEHKIAITVALIAIILSFIVILVQKYCLKRAPSLAVEADHAHYKTDLILNGGVIIALLGNLYGGPQWLDPLLGLFIALYFLRTAIFITSNSFGMLMDRELPNRTRMRIEQLITSHPGIHGMHDLRTRMSGMTIHISFDIELDPDMPLKQAHDIANELDHKILKHYPNAETIIHMDPIGDVDDPRHKDLK